LYRFADEVLMTIKVRIHNSHETAS